MRKNEKRRFNELLKGPDFNAMEKMAEGPDPCIWESAVIEVEEIFISKEHGRQLFFLYRTFLFWRYDIIKNLANKKAINCLYMAKKKKQGIQPRVQLVK